MHSQPCEFQTTRLLVKEWHSFHPGEWVDRDLPSVVVKMLTEAVTKQLPTGWQGVYDVERARQWIADRDAECSTLLVVEMTSGEPVGLVLVFEWMDHDTASVELRVGYLLSEGFWGKGIASELLTGFVEWCSRHGITSIVGGVEKDNIASRRVLEKCGFVCDHEADDVGTGELLYRRQLDTQDDQ